MHFKALGMHTFPELGKLLHDDILFCASNMAVLILCEDATELQVSPDWIAYVAPSHPVGVGDGVNRVLLLKSALKFLEV
jgi:hypothetical protein